MLSFDGRATVGDFTGLTNTVTGELTGGADLSAVRGWVEAPVSTLLTGNGKRDKDLNKSMESGKYPTIRFDLTGVVPGATRGDTVDVTLLGTFRIHGVSRADSIPATVVLLPNTVRVGRDASQPQGLPDRGTVEGYGDAPDARGDLGAPGLDVRDGAGGNGAGRGLNVLTDGYVEGVLMPISLRKPNPHRRSARAGAAALLLTLGCTAGTEPSANPRDLRVDPKAAATVWGYVLAAPTNGLPHNRRPHRFEEPVRGVTVELGRWEGPAIDQGYRGAPLDTAGPQGARMEVIARTKTDHTGRYRFTGVPRYEVVSVMVQGTVWPYSKVLGRYESDLMEPIFWLAHTPERKQDLWLWDRYR